MVALNRFKQTEVGVILEDWSASQIEKVIEINGLIRGPFGGALKKSFLLLKALRFMNGKIQSITP